MKRHIDINVEHACLSLLLQVESWSLNPHIFPLLLKIKAECSEMYSSECGVCPSIHTLIDVHLI